MLARTAIAPLSIRAAGRLFSTFNATAELKALPKWRKVGGFLKTLRDRHVQLTRASVLPFGKQTTGGKSGRDYSYVRVQRLQRGVCVHDADGACCRQGLYPLPVLQFSTTKDKRRAAPTVCSLLPVCFLWPVGGPPPRVEQRVQPRQRGLHDARRGPGKGRRAHSQGHGYGQENGRLLRAVRIQELIQVALQ